MFDETILHTFVLIAVRSVWQDGETIVGVQDLPGLRLQIASDNLVHKKRIPPMIRVLISPGNGGEAQGTRMRQIQYVCRPLWKVPSRRSSSRGGQNLPAASRRLFVRSREHRRERSAHTDQFSRVLSHISTISTTSLLAALKLKGYDFHFRFGEGMHAIAQGALDLPESLAWLWRDYDPASTEQTYEMEEAERVKPVRAGLRPQTGAISPSGTH